MAKKKDVQRRITKVKITDDVMIEYEVVEADGIDVYTLKCNEGPKPAFRKAFRNLADWVDDWLEIGEPAAEAWSRKNLLEVRIEYLGVNAIKAQLVAEVELHSSEAPFKLKTPWKKNELLESDEEELTCTLMSAELEKAIRNLAKHANAYVEGEREQEKLPYE